MRKYLIIASVILLAVACHEKKTDPYAPLPRVAASAEMQQAFEGYLKAVADSSVEMHSIMVLQHGNVIEEKQFAPDTAHIMNSVSKTFTSTAVGFAIREGLLSLDDRIVDIFPDSVPEEASDTLGRVTVRHLLTMNCGHGTDPTYTIREGEGDWIRAFMQWPFKFEPGTCFCYNSLGTYLLSAAVQKVTGQKVVDYLDTRLWQPLGIHKPFWQESPAGINTGGWGLYLRTEDMARMGLCILGGGQFGGKQVIPAEWVAEMGKKQVSSCPDGLNEDALREYGIDPSVSDWLQGYGYQRGRCRHGAFRADGANGQYIIILPEKDAVIVATAHVQDMQKELNLIWDHILPAL